MTTDDLRAAFKAADGDYGRFALITDKRSQRPDLHAFVLLDSVLPGDRDMIACAEHDEIWLAPTLAELAAVATPEIVLELVRCGVRYDTSVDSLAMFV